MEEKYRIDLIAGARPNFMKIAPIIEALDKVIAQGAALHYRLVHTGQHYDKVMSQQFFDELGIPDPDTNLGSGSGTQAEQTAKIMLGYEKLLLQSPADLCLVVGDVTSTMACSIVAKKLGMKVAHVEAGIRSGDLKMPEEINRIVTDSITDYFFTTTEKASAELIRLGASKDNIYFVGNTMIDSLLKNRKSFRKPAIFNQLHLKPKSYLVMTLHRPSNVDEEHKLTALLQTIESNSEGHPVIFPVHPRTRAILNKLNVNYENIYMVDPMGYLEFNYLVEHSKAVITDSGGITEETTVMGVPCMTLRENTERPETVEIGTNELVGVSPENLEKALRKLFLGNWKTGKIPEMWDGKTGERIVSIIDQTFSQIV